MKRIILVAVIGLLCAVQMNAQRTYVLAAGVSAYQEQNKLSQTTKDVKAFAKLMKTQTPDVTVLTSQYASRENILEKLRAICNRAGKNDRVVFFFSGHGGSGAMCAYDGNGGNYMLSYTDLMAVLKSSQAKEKICYVDVCHAGSAANVLNTKEKSYTWSKDASGAQIVFFVSSRADEYSNENSWTGAGFFTRALLKGLQGKADANSDREITVIELFKYIYNDVVSRSNKGQHPQLIASKSAYQIVLTKWK